MSGLDRALDPVTGDYVSAPGGEYEETSSASTAVYHQLKGHRNRWWGDGDAGSDLFLVTTRGLDRATVVFAENAALAALQRLVDDGLIVDPQAVAESLAKIGRLGLETAMVDVQTGQPLTFRPLGEK